MEIRMKSLMVVFLMALFSMSYANSKHFEIGATEECDCDHSNKLRGLPFEESNSNSQAIRKLASLDEATAQEKKYAPKLARLICSKLMGSGDTVSEAVRVIKKAFTRFNLGNPENPEEIIAYMNKTSEYMKCSHQVPGKDPVEMHWTKFVIVNDRYEALFYELLGSKLETTTEQFSANIPECKQVHPDVYCETTLDFVYREIENNNKKYKNNPEKAKLFNQRLHYLAGVLVKNRSLGGYEAKKFEDLAPHVQEQYKEKFKSRQLELATR